MDKDTKNRLEKGERIVEVLKQNRNAPVSVEHQVIIIYAVVNDFLKDIPIGLISDFEKELFEYIDNSYPDINKSIVELKELTPENEQMLKEVLNDFTKKFMSDK